MFSRYFLTFFAVFLIAALVSVSAESEEELEYDEASFDDLSVETRASIGKKVEKILKKFFKNATEKCLKAAVKKCKKNWYNPSKVIKCAKDFLSVENAACLVGA